MHARPAIQLMAFIDIEDVDLVYRNSAGHEATDGTLALQNTSLKMDRGEFVALVGPSGCGKSTLLKIVAGLIRANKGTVNVAGEAVTKPLKIVGMAFQNASLLPWRSTRENVLLPLEIVEPHRQKFRSEKAKYEAMADELLATVGLDGFGDRAPWQLSGGMQQRAQLCRALVHEPDLLLLDEPFGALDAFTREELWDVLQTLYQKRNCTVILVTHDLREAVYLADTVYVMSARPGRVILDRKIDLPRPRKLDDLYSRDIADLIQDLRHHINVARTDPSETL
ncbi:MAG: NitT/TauT family transport system ATP-binding protein [Paracoccaceae bacterium]